MNKVLYLSLVLMGLPLYGMSIEQQKGPAAKTASVAQIELFNQAAYRGDLSEVTAFVKEYSECINEFDKRGYTALLNTIEGAYWLSGNVGSWYEIFEYLLLNGADEQVTCKMAEGEYANVTDLLRHGPEALIPGTTGLNGMPGEWLDRTGHSSRRWFSCLRATTLRRTAKAKAEEEAKKAQAEKVAKEKAMALEIFNQKRQADRRAKEEAKLTASVALKAQEESKQLTSEEKKAIATKPSKEQVNEFTLAAFVGDLDRVKAFVAEFPHSIDAKDAYGSTALWNAVVPFNYEIFDYLLLNGAQVQSNGKILNGSFVPLSDWIKMKIREYGSDKAQAFKEKEMSAKWREQLVADWLARLNLFGMLNASRKIAKSAEEATAPVEVATASTDRVEAFIHAAHDGKLKEVENFVRDYPAGLDLPDGKGYTALLAAVRGHFWGMRGQGCFDVFVFLLRSEASTDSLYEVAGKKLSLAEYIEMGNRNYNEKQGIIDLSVLEEERAQEKEKCIKDQEALTTKWLTCLNTAPERRAKAKAEEEAKKAQAEKVAKEKAMALEIFNQKRQADRKAKDEAKRKAEAAAKAQEESKQLESAGKRVEELQKKRNG